MRATQAESDSRVGVLICLWPALILSPLCFHFSAVMRLHPLLIRALKISFPTQLAFSLSKRCLWCFFFYPPPLSSCGHFLFHVLIKIIIQVTEKEFWSFTGEKNIKEPFSRPIRRLLLVATPGLSVPQGAFHLLLCHKVFFFFFLITFEGRDFRTAELCPAALIYFEWNSGLQSLQNETANNFHFAGESQHNFTTLQLPLNGFIFQTG